LGPTFDENRIELHKKQAEKASARHRSMLQQLIAFHCASLPNDDDGVIRKAFLARVREGLSMLQQLELLQKQQQVMQVRCTRPFHSYELVLKKSVQQEHSQPQSEDAKLPFMFARAMRFTRESSVNVRHSEELEHKASLFVGQIVRLVMDKGEPLQRSKRFEDALAVLEDSSISKQPQAFEPKDDHSSRNTKGGMLCPMARKRVCNTTDIAERAAEAVITAPKRARIEMGSGSCSAFCCVAKE
jgi:hypothetical protein